MGLLNIDKDICLFYAEKLLKPIQVGENGVFFWFPGTGMGTIVKDVISNKKILNKYLGAFVKRTKILEFWGHIADVKTLEGLLMASAFSSSEELDTFVKSSLNKGWEIGIFLTKIDDFNNSAKIKILKYFLKISLINKRRIHIIFSSTDKPWFEKNLQIHPELLGLANEFECMDCLNKSIIEKFIDERSVQFDCSINLKEKKYLYETYGGVIQLIKEFIRSKGNPHNLELKAKVIWNQIPPIYKKILKGYVLNEVKNSGFKQIQDLKNFGVLDLGLFRQHWNVFNDHPEKLLPKILTNEELTLWNKFNSDTRKLINKETVIELLRPSKKEEISLWAVDQAVSRFRKKLAKVGIDPENLVTMKGRGYVWKG